MQGITLQKILESIFETLWYAILIFIASFFINRFGNENWAPLYPFSGFAISLILAHSALSFSQEKEAKLMTRLFLPLVGMLFFWYGGDFTRGIVNAFQQQIGFLEVFILFILICISLFVTNYEKIFPETFGVKNSEEPQKTSLKPTFRAFSEIVGQDHVIEPLKEIARLAGAKIRVGKENAPYAVLLFLGPTGVGKTEAARALAKAVYGSEDALIRFDMGQFADSHQASRFYGPPPGYVGYEQGGQLTRAVLKKPRSVVLLDEVEKADKKIWDAFLPVFDEGYIVDGSSNQKVDMRQTIIVLTSNLLTERENIFSKSALEIKDLVQQTGAFRPELIGRINEVLVFKSLSVATIREILQRRVDNALWRLAEQGIRLSIEPDQIDEMVKEIQAAKFGVRQIDDVLRMHIRKLIAVDSTNGQFLD